MDYNSIVRHYEECFLKHGDNWLGVDWPNQKDAETRYQVMLEAVRENKASILDFGCGLAHLYQYMLDNGCPYKYTGMDLSPRFIEACRVKYPDVDFYCQDILDSSTSIYGGTYDYILMNGVFTEKNDLSFEEMEVYFHKMLKKIYMWADRGIAFNVMSGEVDYEREDLFYMKTDRLIHFLTRNLSRNFVIRNDYGLWEYTVYVYKESAFR